MNTQGTANRVAGRDYYELALAPESKEPLVAAQRRRLNELVNAIVADNPDLQSWQLWQDVVHSRVGVESINDITRDQFTLAESALISHRELLQREQRQRTLIGVILRLVNEQDRKAELSTYCQREFGETQLKGLELEQLHQIIGHFDNATATPGHQPGWWFMILAFMLGVLTGLVLPYL